MFIWAALEATVWPIIPEFFLVPMAAAVGFRAYRPLAAAIAGSFAGGVVMVLYAGAAPTTAVSLLHHLPLVLPRQIAGAQQQLLAHGTAAFWYQPWSGISFKIWAVLAGHDKMSPTTVIPLFTVARSLRMALYAVLAGVAGQISRRFLRDFSLFIIVIYTALFADGLWRTLAGT